MSRREAEVFFDVIASDDCGLVSDIRIDDAGLISDHWLMHCKIRVLRSVVRPFEVSFRKVLEHRHTYLRTGASSVDPVYKPCFN